MKKCPYTLVKMVNLKKKEKILTYARHYSKYFAAINLLNP